MMATFVIRRISARNLLNLNKFPNYTALCACNTSNIYTNWQNKKDSLFHKQSLHTNYVVSKFNTKHVTFRNYSNKDTHQDNDEKKLTLFQRFKQMYKEYWYVLVPVHVVTSIGWFGGFYYMAKSGVDIVPLLEYLHVSDKIVNPLRDSSVGYIAVAYALYKIATPLRYTVTLGGTTISINYLKKWGYIKPVPSTQRLKEMYQEKKDNILESVRETKEGLKMQSEKLKDAMENFEDSIKHVNNKKSDVEKVKKELKKNN